MTKYQTPIHVLSSTKAFQDCIWKDSLASSISEISTPALFQSKFGNKTCSPSSKYLQLKCFSYMLCTLQASNHPLT